MTAAWWAGATSATAIASVWTAQPRQSVRHWAWLTSACMVCQEATLVGGKQTGNGLRGQPIYRKSLCLGFLLADHVRREFVKSV